MSGARTDDLRIWRNTAKTLILAGIVMDLFDLQYAFYLGAGVMTAGTLVFLAGMYGGDRSATG